MAVFWRKIVHHSWQICPKEEISSSIPRLGSRGSRGNCEIRAKSHFRKFALLSCSQIPHGGAGCSPNNQPELSGSRFMTDCVDSAAEPAPGPGNPQAHTNAVECQQSPSIYMATSSTNIRSFLSRTNILNNEKEVYCTGGHLQEKWQNVNPASCVFAAADHKPTIQKFASHFNFKFSSLQKYHQHQSNNQLLCSTNSSFLQGCREKMSRMQVRNYAARRTHNRKEKSYYEVLGITPNATQAQIKESYFKLSKVYHPDKNAGSKEAQRQFAAINEAYSVLGNLTLRKRFDRGMLREQDVHGEVSQEEKEKEKHTGDAVYTGSGLPFHEEAERQAKNLDDFFSKHYREARTKEQRDRAERKQRMDEYMELQQKAKLSPVILAAFMLAAVTLAVKSATKASWEKKLSGQSKEKQ